MIPPRLFECSGAHASAETHAENRTTGRLDTLGQNPNVHLRIDNVTKAFGSALPPRIVDLLEIASYVYTADCASRRDGEWVNDAVEQWGRDIRLAVAVRDPVFWSRSDVVSSLMALLQFMTSDAFSFEFSPLADRSWTIQQYLGLTQVSETPFYNIDRVTLFSGGLDSLAGASIAANNGEPLAFVGHRPVSHVDQRQATLVKELKSKFDVPILHNPVWVNKKNLDRESSQRSRVFLFGVLAAAIASVLKARGIRFYENGVISVNLPLADEALQSRSSRTTHPHTLHLLQSFLRLALEEPSFVVDNPFIYKTKTEVVAELAASDCAHLIRHSCSCVNTRHTSGGATHCGRCGQCIDRRVAIVAAGLEQYDPQSLYATNVFTGERPLNPKHPYGHNIAVNYMRFAREIEATDEFRIAERYAMELGRATRHFDEPRVAVAEMTSMLKRHGSSVMAALTQTIQEHADEIAKGSLPDDSLLGMVVNNSLSSVALPSAQPVLAPSKLQNGFMRKGAIWDLTYNQQTTSVRHSLGMLYIKELLANPGQHISSLDFVTRFSKRGASDADGAGIATVSAAEADEYGFWVSNGHSNDPVLGEDRKYQQTLREVQKNASMDLQAAKRSLSSAKIKQAQDALNAVENVLKSSRRRGGKSRDFPTEADAARSSVRAAITTAWNRIGEASPELAAHLRTSIKTGERCIYLPEQTILWET